MNLYDAHNARLNIGDRILFTGTIKRIFSDDGEHTIWVQSDLQPEGLTVETQLHPRTVEHLKDES